MRTNDNYKRFNLDHQFSSIDFEYCVYDNGFLYPDCHIIRNLESLDLSLFLDKGKS